MFFTKEGNKTSLVPQNKKVQGSNEDLFAKNADANHKNEVS
jgi:hypothetical protein